MSIQSGFRRLGMKADYKMAISVIHYALNLLPPEND
jgi:hypothetical protein